MYYQKRFQWYNYTQQEIDNWSMNHKCKSIIKIIGTLCPSFLWGRHHNVIECNSRGNLKSRTSGVSVAFQSTYFGDLFWSVSKNYHDNGIKYTPIARNIDCTSPTLKKASKTPSKAASVKESIQRFAERPSTYFVLFIHSDFASCQSLEL